MEGRIGNDEAIARLPCVARTLIGLTILVFTASPLAAAHSVREAPP